MIEGEECGRTYRPEQPVPDAACVMHWRMQGEMPEMSVGTAPAEPEADCAFTPAKAAAARTRADAESCMVSCRSTGVWYGVRGASTRDVLERGGEAYICVLADVAKVEDRTRRKRAWELVRGRRLSQMAGLPSRCMFPRGAMLGL